MSLATRCVACGTIFRVVQDQLKVSEGWVRCGRCDEVFNALDGLFDLDREPPPRWTAPPSTSAADTADGIVIDTPGSVSRPGIAAKEPRHEAPVDSGPFADGEHGSRPFDAAPFDGVTPEIDSGSGTPHRHADDDTMTADGSGFRLRDPYRDPVPALSPTKPASQPRSGSWFGSSQPLVDTENLETVKSEPLQAERSDPAWDPSGSAHAEPGSDAKPSDPVMPPADEAPADSADSISMPMAFTPMPAFVARADRDALWRRPGRLAGLVALTLLLVTLLGAQAMHHFRDTVAARWPATREPLERWCAVADCRLAAPRRIEDVVVENTGLTKAAAGINTYRLGVTLHNRGTHLIAMPHVDLTLTDNSGQLVARRALAPADFEGPAGKIAAELAPNADLPLQVVIATGNSKVSGYTVEIFYP